MHLAGRECQRDIAQQAGAGALEHGGEVADVEERRGHLSTGSKRSFSPSPSWLKESTVRNKVISGKTSTHHA